MDDKKMSKRMLRLYNELNELFCKHMDSKEKDEAWVKERASEHDDVVMVAAALQVLGSRIGHQAGCSGPGCLLSAVEVLMREVAVKHPLHGQKAQGTDVPTFAYFGNKEVPKA